MASFNRVILMGNLTRDVELKYLQSGMAVTEVGLAVNDRRRTQSGEFVEETTFVDVTIWGRQAEVVSEYLGKGSPILIEGRLKLDSWENNEGQKRSKVRVVCERMQMLGAPRGSAADRPPTNRPESEYSQPVAAPSGPASAQTASAPADAAPPPANQPPQDDIPF